MHLFSKENIWSNPHASSIHPVIQTRTIILWTELFPKKRREKIQGEILQSIFEYSGVSTFLQELQFYTQSSRFPVIPCYSTYRINSSPRNTTTTRLIPCRLLPATVPRVSKHSTRQNPAIRLPAPYSTPSAPHGTSRLPVILPGRNSILHGRQHPRTPYSSSQASSTLQNSTRRNRILSKRVKYCISNTILRSVCSNLLILALE